MPSSAPEWIDRVCEAMRDHERARPRYEPIEEIGRGGMAVVYRARDHKLQRDVALKVLREDLEVGPEDRTRFRREAEAAARLSHPNVVTLLDAGEEDGRLFLVMELVRGEPLDRAEHPSPELLVPIARGVHHAHLQGIVHRDLKPSNILLTETGVPKVTDFGVAHLTDSTRLTQSGSILGTPLYMAPEQVQGRAVSARTDVYALGALLYEILVGRPPHEGETAMEIFGKIVHEEPIPPRRLVASVPLPLDTICLLALEKDPTRRYATAEAFADDLSKALEGRPIEARRVSRLGRIWRKVKRHKGRAALASAWLVAALAVGGWLGVSRLQVSRQIREGLATAAQREEQGDAAGARDALLVVLSLNESHAEARASLRRIELRLEEERRRLENAGADAKAILQKSQAVATVLQRWSRLQGPLREVESIYYDWTLTSEERRTQASAVWGPEIQRKFAEETPQDSASQATFLALTGWALRWSIDEKSGLQFMRLAAQTDPDVPFGSLMEALVLMEQFFYEVEWPTVILGEKGVRWLPCPSTPPPSETASQLSSLLKKAETARVWGRESAEDFRKTVRAFQAIQTGDFAAADPLLTQVADAPDLSVFRRHLLVARARGRFYLQRYEEGLKDLLEVAQVRKGQASLYGLMGEFLLQQAREALRRGEDPRTLFEESIRISTESVVRDPRSPEGYLTRANAYFARGNLESHRGEDPRDSYDRTIADCTRSLPLLEMKLPCRVNRGVAYLMKAMYEAARGLDATPSLDAALRDLEEAIRQNGEHPSAHFNLAMVLQEQADTELRRGDDPAASLQRELRVLEVARRLEPDTPESYYASAMAHHTQGRFHLWRGRDPGRHFEEARTQLQEALHRASRYAHALQTWGNVEIDTGDWLTSQGIDPRPAYSAAVNRFTQAIDTRPPDIAPLYSSRGLAHLRLAEAGAARGVDPNPNLEKAIDDCDAALRHHSTLAAALGNRSLAYLFQGRRLRASGEDPRAMFQKALADVNRVVEINPRYAEAYLNRGAIRMALMKAEPTRSPLPEIEKAIEDYTTALKLNPQQSPAYFNRGLSYYARGKLGHDDSYEKACSDFTESIARGCQVANAYYYRGSCRFHFGTTRGSTEFFREAIADFDEALQREPTLWQAWTVKGQAYECMNRPVDAVTCYETSLQIEPNQPAIRPMLERARKAAGK